MAPSPGGPAEPVGHVAHGPDERCEQSLDFVAGERDQPVRGGMASVFVGPDDGEEDVGEHGQGHRGGRPAAVVGEFAGGAVAADQQLVTAGCWFGQVEDGPVVEAVSLGAGPGRQLLPAPHPRRAVAQVRVRAHRRVRCRRPTWPGRAGAACRPDWSPRPTRRHSSSSCAAGPTAVPAPSPLPGAGVQPARTGPLSGPSGP